MILQWAKQRAQSTDLTVVEMTEILLYIIKKIIIRIIVFLYVLFCSAVLKLDCVRTLFLPTKTDT